MKIVIDIPKEQYEIIKELAKNQNSFCPEADSAEKIISRGTPLPKNHGDLIDKEKLKENINGWYAFMKNICKQPCMTLKQEEIIGKIDMMKPIIEAENEEEE